MQRVAASHTARVITVWVDEVAGEFNRLLQYFQDPWIGIVLINFSKKGNGGGKITGVHSIVFARPTFLRVVIFGKSAEKLLKAVFEFGVTQQLVGFPNRETRHGMMIRQVIFLGLGRDDKASSAENRL